MLRRRAGAACGAGSATPRGRHTRGPPAAPPPHRRNAGCWFLDTSTCLAGWPNHATDAAVKWYYHAELAWYLHMLLKPVLRYGLKDGRDMLVHHYATLALVVVSYGAR